MLSNKLTFSLVLVLVMALVATPVLAQTTDAVGEIAADGDFAIVGRSTTPAGTTVTGAVASTTLPNLAELLRRGGTIELQLSMGTDNAAAEAAKGASPGATSDEKKKSMWHSAIISEIMWAEDRPSADGAEDDAQWIEVYNHKAGELAATPDVDAKSLRLVYYTTRNTTGADAVIETDFDAEADDAAEATADTDNDGLDDDAVWVLVDRVSTVNNFNILWTALGQSGNSEIGDEDRDADVITDFISMYRKVTIEAGEYKTADTGALDALGLGTESDSWAASVGSVNTVFSAEGAAYIGSPSTIHRAAGGVIKTFAKAPATVPPTMNFGTEDAPKNLDPGSGVIINEVRNDTSGANLDWIELFNNTDPNAPGVTATNLENWELSRVRARWNTDTGSYHTSGDDNFWDDSLAVLPRYKLAPGEYLVIYNRDPGETGLAGGVNIEAVDAGTQINKGASHVYVVRRSLHLFNYEPFLIILRSVNDKRGTHEKVVDYVGDSFFRRQKPNEFDTEVWPFVGWTAPTDVEPFGSFALNDRSWGRITELGHAVGTDDPKEAAKRASTELNRGVYWPKSREGNRGHIDDWATFGFVGTGYDRAVDRRASPGTPGYTNMAINVVAHDRDGAAKHDPYKFSGTVTISEVMYDAGPRWNLVQWIELYNSSMTETIDISGWELEIRNKEDVTSYVDANFLFIPGTVILPNQTLLLVSGSGANDVDSNRVYNLYQHHRRVLGLLARDSILLSRTGFYIKLTAPVTAGGRTDVTMIMDEGGNVDVQGAQRNVIWPLPTRDPAARQSLVRVYGTGAGAREIDGTRDMAAVGAMESSWKQSDITGAGLSYYGHRNDISTPGFRLGGPLPVSLSSFRPVRNQVTGHVDITWVTQSELNNAGFNILRSEGKGHAFKVINVKGIVAGHGTTSEKHVYKFTDTSAKPNVVYYYQIEDVSLDGKRTTLRTTHLRGNVSAGGKLTTTWSNLKLQK